MLITGGVIPDSTMIHAARKRRQMARDMGAPGDYMSLNAAENGAESTANRKSRLVRYVNQSSSIINLHEKFNLLI